MIWWRLYANTYLTAVNRRSLARKSGPWRRSNGCAASSATNFRAAVSAIRSGTQVEFPEPHRRCRMHQLAELVTPYRERGTKGLMSIDEILQRRPESGSVERTLEQDRTGQTVGGGFIIHFLQHPEPRLPVRGGVNCRRRGGLWKFRKRFDLISPVRSAIQAPVSLSGRNLPSVAEALLCRSGGPGEMMDPWARPLQLALLPQRSSV